MSNVRFILTLGFLICIFACHHVSHYPQTMLRAEQLMDTAPDSALAILSNLQDSVPFVDEVTQMYYHLLTIKAKDKCYILHTSDSLIKEIVHYYNEHGTSAQQMESYYYLGSTYRDMQDAPRALKNFQEAVCASVDGRECKILSRIYNQMGTLYMHLKLYDEALPVYKKAYRCTLLAKDSLSLPYALRDIGRVFTAKHDADSALYYYEAGYQAAKCLNDTNRMSIVQGEMANIYIQLGRYEEARKILFQTLGVLEDNDDIASHYSSIGDVYKGIRQLDSAVFYYRKALEIGNIYVRRGVCWELYGIAKNNSNNKEAMQHMDQYLICQDSVQRITDIEAVKRVEILYNYNHVEEEHSQLALSNEKKRSFIYRLVIGVFLLLLVFGGILFYGRKKKLLQIEQERRLSFLEEIRHKESLEQIERNKEEIIPLKSQLAIVREQKDLTKAELLTIRTKSLEKQNSSIATSRLEREVLIALFYHSPIYLLIVKNCKTPGFRLEESHWQELQREIDATYNDFTNRLYALYPKLSVVELRVCYLIKMSVNATDIANLIHRKINTVSSIRERLYRKIHGVPGSTKMMDAFIVDF